ncbi:MAG: sugar ABC transporter permease [Chloroflexota bacterium]|nr:sugar ABC transporter permease [Chloroflexota bacterium]PLS79527.1 MAG: sugar ABC transporter permease [Chloroflexota bacterium]
MATSQQAGTQTIATTGTPARRRVNFVPYLFILPHLIFFTAFLAYPFFYGIYISLFNFDFLRPEFRPFVGLQNYNNILFNRNSVQFTDFWSAIGNTAQFILYSVPFLVIFALLLAVLLNGNYRGRNVFRGLYFAPYALSVTVAAVLWRWIFENGGLLDTYLTRIGLPPLGGLGAQPGAWIGITVATIWWTIGFNTVIFLAALQEIPESLYEAASLDGANKVQQFFRITIPMLRPVLVFVITIALLASANLFGQPHIMTGVQSRVVGTESIVQRIYDEGIIQYRMGSAAAMSVSVAAVLLLLTTLNFRIFGRGEQQ